MRPVVLGLVLAALCSGCSATAGDEQAAPRESVLEALRLAQQEGDAGSEQVATLEQARDEGRDVTDEEFRTAYASAVDCTREAGVTVVDVQETYDAGLLQLNMVVQGKEADEDFMFSAMGECEHKFSSYLDIARQLSSTAIAAQDAIIAEHLPAMLECVRGKGANLDDDATYDEVISEDPDLSDPEKSCVVTTGLQAALNAPSGN